jgi:regulator of protease activity HflC (stomatin/prohibitin superfamily)
VIAALIVVLALLVVTAVVLVSTSIRVLREYERGVVFRLGRSEPPHNHAPGSSPGDHHP